MKIFNQSPGILTQTEPQIKISNPPTSSTKKALNPSTDKFTLSTSLKAGGQRFVEGSIEATKAVALPAAVGGAIALAASEPMARGLGVLAGSAVGLIGAAATGLIVGGTANALGAGKATSTSGGALAGAAAGFFLNNTGSIKSRIITAGIGATIGGIAGYNGSGAKLEGDPALNAWTGVMVGLTGGAILGAAASGFKEPGVAATWASIGLSIGGAIGGAEAAAQIQESYDE